MLQKDLDSNVGDLCLENKYMKQKIHLLYLKDELIFFYEKFISLKLVSSKTKFYDEFRKSVNVDDRTDFVVILSI